MALKYNDFAKGYGGGFKISGALPVDIRQVVEYKSDLTSSATWTGTKVYHGLLVSVHSEHQVYMFSPDSETPAQLQFDPTIEANWKKIGGSNATITAVTVEEYPGYITEDDVKIAVYQNAQEQWVRADTDEVTSLTPTLAENIFAESEHSDLPTDEKGIVIEASSVINGGAGTYIKVEDEEGHISYSKINVDSLILLINDVSTRVNNLKEYVDTQDSSLKIYVDNLSTNVDEIAQHVSDISSFIDTSIGFDDEDYARYPTIKEYIDSKDISEWVENVSNAVDNVSTALNELILAGIVNSIESTTEYISTDPSNGNVYLDASVVSSSDGETFANTALVTNGYVEEKLSWIEVEDQEESEEIEESEE